MKYLVVYPSPNGEEKVLCADDCEAIELAEKKLLDGVADGEIKFYAAEPVVFHVKRVPVVTLDNTLGNNISETGENTEAAVESQEAKVDDAQPSAADFPSASFSSVVDADKTANESPFAGEQVFSIDS